MRRNEIYKLSSQFFEITSIPFFQAISQEQINLQPWKSNSILDKMKRSFAPITGSQRKRKREEEQQAIVDRAAKRAARGTRNTAVTVDFNTETERLLDELEKLRTRTKRYDPGRYDRVEDTPRRTRAWGNGLQFAQRHFATEEEGLQAIESITTQVRALIRYPFAEEDLIQQWEAIISARASRTATIPEMAQAMVGELRTAIMANTAVMRQNYNTLRSAGSTIMTLVPFDDYMELVPGSERGMENAARWRMRGKAATPGALERLQRRTRKIGEDEEIDPEEICTVCQEQYQVGETVIEMKCDHVFHQDCVQGWLSTRVPQCPLCRQSISVSNASNPGSRGSGGEKAAGGDEIAPAEGAAAPGRKAAKMETFDDIVEPPQPGRERVQRCFSCRMLLCFGMCGQSSGEEE